MGAPFVKTYQAKLHEVLTQIFSKEDIFFNARKLSLVKNPATGKYLEIDVWIPKLQLGFEFQDDYHYTPTWYSHTLLSSVQEKDNAKRSFFLQKRGTLIYVPFWWNGNTDSLISTINFFRPDLFNYVYNGDNYNDMIDIVPLNPSIGSFKERGIPGVGALMLASFPFEIVDISKNSWWLGEKYDGIRCCWNPVVDCLFSRHGLEIELLPIFNKHLTSRFLDSEIWFGRGQFNSAQSVIHSIDNIDWSQFRLVSFDEASVEMRDFPFEYRYETLVTHIRKTNPIVQIAPRFLVSGMATIAKNLNHLVESGSEGIIIRKPRSTYESGRSLSLFKLKTLARNDQEALVTNVSDDGSLQLQLPEGTEFQVDKSNIECKKGEVKKGDIVTFSFDFQARKSLPTNPFVHRVRSDLSWQDVVKNYLSMNMQEQKSYTEKPKGYWVSNQNLNMRKVLENIAKKLNINPLIPEDWYSVSLNQIAQYKEASTLLNYYGGVGNAVRNLFPEVNLDFSKFDATPRKYWMDIGNRRELYERFAHSKGSNPLDAQFWYTLLRSDLRSFKGGGTTVKYYQDFQESVIHLFPEINWDRSKFTQISLNSWMDSNSRRKYFDDFAQKRGFDPLVPNNWYLITRDDFDNFVGLESILRYHEGKFSQCLSDLYHEVTFDFHKFKKVPTKSPFARIPGTSPIKPINEVESKSNTEHEINQLIDLHSATKASLPSIGRNLPDVGELMIVSVPNPDFVLASHSWWMGEQYFGIRFCWNPKIDKIYSRYGRELSLLPSFKSLTPDLFIDGELWFGRQTNVIEANLQESFFYKVRWDLLRIVCCDVPAKDFHHFSFEKRVRMLLQTDWEHSFCIIPSKILCIDKGHLEHYTKCIIESGGEGVIVNRVESVYNNGYCDNYLSFKNASYEKEGLVVRAAPQMIDIELDNKERMYIEVNETLAAVPKAGDFISFIYEIDSSNEKTIRNVRIINQIDSNSKGLSSDMWSAETMRAFFINLITEHHLDPKAPSSWYDIPLNSIYQSQIARNIIKIYGGYSETLESLFPEIGLDRFFNSLPRVWQYPMNRRQYFEEYAREKQFNPLEPQHWYSHPVSEIKASKNDVILRFHNGSVAQALVELFPEIGLDKSKILEVTYRRNSLAGDSKKSGFWKEASNRRKFFENYAKTNNFDPLISSQWLNHTRKQIKAQGGSMVLSHYKGLQDALLTLFPDMKRTFK